MNAAVPRIADVEAGQFLNEETMQYKRNRMVERTGGSSQRTRRSTVLTVALVVALRSCMWRHTPAYMAMETTEMVAETMAQMVAMMVWQVEAMKSKKVRRRMKGKATMQFASSESNGATYCESMGNDAVWMVDAEEESVGAEERQILKGGRRCRGEAEFKGKTTVHV